MQKRKRTEKAIDDQEVYFRELSVGGAPEEKLRIEVAAQNLDRNEDPRLTLTLVWQPEATGHGDGQLTLIRVAPRRVVRGCPIHGGSPAFLESLPMGCYELELDLGGSAMRLSLELRSPADTHVNLIA